MYETIVKIHKYIYIRYYCVSICKKKRLVTVVFTVEKKIKKCVLMLY